MENPVADNFERKESQQLLLEEIKNLSERDRAILSLYYYEELSFKEIARLLSCSVQRVHEVHEKILLLLKNEICRQA